jgi:hypothetical protein
MRSELDQFPNLTDADRHMLADNVGAALDTNLNLGDQAEQIVAVARTAFVDSMHSSLWVAAGLAFCAAIVTFTQLPRRTVPDVHAGRHGRHHNGHHGHSEVTEVSTSADMSAS